MLSHFFAISSPATLKFKLLRGHNRSLSMISFYYFLSNNAMVLNYYYGPYQRITPGETLQLCMLVWKLYIWFLALKYFATTFLTIWTIRLLITHSYNASLISDSETVSFSTLTDPNNDAAIDNWRKNTNINYCASAVSKRCLWTVLGV